jgi:hypothetical protein
MRLVSSSFALALLGLAACGSQSADTGSSGTTTTTTSTNTDPGGRPGCSRGVIEPDLAKTPFSGPGVDATTGQLMPLPSTAIMSSTYLTLRSDPAGQKAFNQLMFPILEEIGSSPAPGLLAVTLGTSTSCSTGRTLAVWKDEMSMLAFVMGPAHSKAVESVGEVSTGGSVVTSWASTDPADATWKVAAEHVAEQDGPYY